MSFFPSDINLEHLIDECKTLQEKLSAPHRHEGYNDITQTFVFTEAKIKVVDYRNKLVKARERLKSLWQQAEDRIMLASKVNKYKLKAEKVSCDTNFAIFEVMTNFTNFEVIALLVIDV